MRNLFLSVAFLIIATSGYAQKQSKYPKLDQYFKTLSENNKFMGSIAISKGDSVIYSNVVGYEDIGTKEQPTDELEYKIGSISKSFTAVLIMQAVERGLLTLNTTLDKYIPSIPNSNNITIEHLLRHRSGITDYFGIHNMSKLTEYKPRNEMLDTVISIGKRGVTVATDSITSYSNSNYLLLTYILEDIYDEKFAEILNTNIVEPLGLKNTCMPDSQQGHYSYIFAGDRWEVVKDTHPSSILGAGGIVSTPTELNIFYHALFNGKLVSAESLEQMKETDRSSMLPLGIGLLNLSSKERAIYGHTGSINGYISTSTYCPEDKISISTISNGMNYHYYMIMAIVSNSVYNIPFDIPKFKHTTLSKEDIERYVGINYKGLQRGDTIKFINQENILVLSSIDEKDLSRLTSIARDTFAFFTSGAKLDIIFSDNKEELTVKVNGVPFKYLDMNSEKYTIESNKKPIILTEEDLDKYLGIYNTSDKLPEIEITKKGNIMVARRTGYNSFNLTPTDEHTFEFTAIDLVIIFDPDKGIMTYKRNGAILVYKKEDLQNSTN